ncbi:MAG: NADH dehydrogenase (quinone) subunit G [Deltaproteobacteria bacterium]|nr:NADH dehydrogenase (quinone) subunit G [Deltaproteobacteria bacterium]TLN04453.1 MAG: NADH-quinone oxidoreductase subunit NuoG [bacterium]
MLKLVIDTIELEVPAGTLILEAARSVGIMIPHFCYHPALGNAGACRVCAVKLLDGPVKGIQMSCMTPVQEGMVVSTTDADAVAMRRHVIEWLMINHPHDCPVCDEGGECLLQDYTIAAGHGIRRYQGKKRTHSNQYLGEHVQHEMNRCIQCYRCVRFYQDFAGGSDLGVMGRASTIYYGRFSEGSLESPFSGNLPDLCPTGVYTDKAARFRARYWDYDMAPSLCPHCSLGCATIPAARYRELLKIMARRNDAVNGWFLCDRGRFADHGVNSQDRPRTPLLDGRETTWDEALGALTTRIGELFVTNGPGSLAVVGSPRMTLEGNYQAALLAGFLQAGALCYFVDREEAAAASAAVSLLTRDTAVSLAEVARADCIALVESDLRDQGPMLLLAIRQAWRKGAKVFLVGEGSPREQTDAVSVETLRVQTLADIPLTDYSNPLVIVTPSGSGTADIEKAVAAGAKLVFPLSGPNAFAAALLTREHRASSLAEALASGTIKGLLAFEADIPEEFLSGISLLAVADRFPSAVMKKCDVFLPVTAWVEMDGTFINNEGRAQRFRKVMHPGLPIKGLDPALHPPRVHRADAPGGEPRPAWRIIADLAERLGAEQVEEPLTGRWEFLRDLDPEGEGEQVL